LTIRFRGGLVFKAHRLVYHSTLGWRVIKKKITRDMHGDLQDAVRKLVWPLPLSSEFGTYKTVKARFWL